MSEIKKDKLCKHCGKIYHSYQKTSQYCSYSCSVLAHTKHKNTTVACGCCGSLFIAKWKGNKYCSGKCQREALKRTHQYTCQCCGKEYTAKTVDRNKYCSRECAYKHKAERSQDRLRKLRKTKLLLNTSVCSVCGSKYVKLIPQQVCCTDNCRKLYNRMAAKRYSEKKHLKINRKCICGKSFTPKYGEKNKVYCSKKCAKKYIGKTAKHRRKAKIKKLESTLTNTQWFEILNHFDNTCAYCGRQSDKPLHQDHFYPLSKGGEYTKNNIVPACFECNIDKSNKLFGEWYPTYKYQSIFLKNKLLKHLGYDKSAINQQLTLCV